MDDILSFFHHIHHQKGRHIVHHCGAKHREINSRLDYTIKHCSCGKHSIDREFAIGHITNEKMEFNEVKIKFQERCPDGGWHIESGLKKFSRRG